MLSSRNVNTQISDEPIKLQNKKLAAKKRSQLKNVTTNKLASGIPVSSTNLRKPRPLQPSTNIINAQETRRIPLASKPLESKNLNKSDLKDDITEKAKLSARESCKKTAKKETRPSKSDENDISHFITNPYDPSSDFYPLDNELYEKILKLELADDGLPDCKCDEPFDF